MMDPDPFERLRSAAGPLWTDFTGHPFVRGLGDGTLPTPAFQRYLMQDYLFLIQFARAYALAGYKAQGLADLRAAADGCAAILGELPLHVSFCAGWGLDEAGMAAEPEALETVALHPLRAGLRRSGRPPRPVCGAGSLRARLCGDRATACRPASVRQPVRAVDRHLCRAGLPGGCRHDTERARPALDRARR